MLPHWTGIRACFWCFQSIHGTNRFINLDLKQASIISGFLLPLSDSLHPVVLWSLCSVVWYATMSSGISSPNVPPHLCVSRTLWDVNKGMWRLVCCVCLLHIMRADRSELRVCILFFRIWRNGSRQSWFVCCGCSCHVTTLVHLAHFLQTVRKWH